MTNECVIDKDGVLHTFQRVYADNLRRGRGLPGMTVDVERVQVNYSSAIFVGFMFARCGRISVDYCVFSWRRKTCMSYLAIVSQNWRENVVSLLLSSSLVRCLRTPP